MAPAVAGGDLPVHVMNVAAWRRVMGVCIAGRTSLQCAIGCKRPVWDGCTSQSCHGHGAGAHTGTPAGGRRFSAGNGQDSSVQTTMSSPQRDAFRCSRGTASTPKRWLVWPRPPSPLLTPFEKGCCPCDAYPGDFRSSHRLQSEQMAAGADSRWRLSARYPHCCGRHL